MRALQKTSSIEQDQARILPIAFDEIVATRPDALAVIDEYENLSFRQFAERANRYARWALANELQKGDVVALLMGNRADYAAIWLGLTRVGVVVALLNNHVAAPALAHCLRVAKAGHVIVDDPHYEACGAAAELVGDALNVVSFDEATIRGAASVAECKGLSGEPMGMEDSRDVTLKDRALYIFTSGTTGLPKAAIVTHRRVMNWSLWFSGLTMRARRTACIIACRCITRSAEWSRSGRRCWRGGSVVLRARFSASGFWKDVVTHRCTMFQYIGELCRYLLNAPDCDEQKRQHGSGSPWAMGCAPTFGPVSARIWGSENSGILRGDRKQFLAL